MHQLSRFFKLCLPILIACSIHTLGAEETKSIGDPKGTNFPMDAEGRVYHLGIKRGEVANRILMVGDPDRAKLILEELDSPNEAFVYASNRGFTTYTGTKNGVPVTIMSIGMGMPMMDFAVREIRAITDGHLAIIRLGSCGTPNTTVPVGSVVVAKESYGIVTNYDAYHCVDSEKQPFTITTPIAADSELTESLITSLQKNSGDTFPIVQAIDATADSFYGSQGRTDSQFQDKNESLIDTIMDLYPMTASLQMETYHLYHLAKINSYGQIHTAACAIVLAQRKSDEFLSNDEKHLREKKAGNACLEALASYPIK